MTGPELAAPRPRNLIAELTYRCPLRCPYCSNPTDYASRREALSAEDWGRVFHEAAALGVLHVGLTGGEPSTRTDLPEIVGHAADAGLYAHLVTAGMPIGADGLAVLVRRGLRSVQLSIQDASETDSDAVAGTPSFGRKLDFARAVREQDLPLILNVVLHRRNIENIDAIIELARDLDAERLELAHTQYHGWALTNRAALLPSPKQIEATAAAVREAKRRPGGPELLLVLPDYFAGRPKPCMGGWGRSHIVVTPEGSVQPCHNAGTLPDLEFWQVPERSLAACWSEAPGMNAFRGEGWMREPCRSCPERATDFGGCRCQAFALSGDAAIADPACSLSPAHDEVAHAIREASDEWNFRGPQGQ